MSIRCSVQFWSSTEYSGFLRGLIRELKERRILARQRFQITEAGYRAARSTVARLWLRVRQYIVYPIQLISVLLIERLFRRQADICVVSTNTFYAPLLATYLHPNVVHLVYDLFPEAMVHAGKWQANSLKVKWIRWIVRKTFRRSKMNVFLGERLKDYIESLQGALPNAAVIEVGGDQLLFEQDTQVSAESLATFKAQPNKETGIEILYCGNFGNLHDSETLFRLWNKVAERLRSEEGRGHPLCKQLRWLFHCFGPKRADLMKVREDLPDVLKKQILVSGGLGQTEWIAVMKVADIALVTMTSGSEKVVMPSKAYSAMMVGQAILAIAPECSDLVDTIKAADCGWWVEPGDVSGFEQLLELISSDPHELLRKRKRAYDFAHDHYGQGVLAEKWRTLFETVACRINIHE